MDAITLFLYMFFGFVLLMVILIGIAFLRAIFGIHPASGNQTNSKIAEEEIRQEDDHLNEDSIEDSEGDGLMLFDDPMFPPEFDDEDDDS